MKSDDMRDGSEGEHSRFGKWSEVDESPIMGESSAYYSQHLVREVCVQHVRYRMAECLSDCSVLSGFGQWVLSVHIFNQHSTYR